MIVLALDCSLTSTGWATRTPTPSGGSLLHHGTITPTARRPDGTRRQLGPDTPDARRLYIAGQIRQLIRTHHPHLIAIESYAYSRHSRATTTLAELGGVIRAAIYGTGTPYIEIPASTLKAYATGYGQAPKRTGEVRGQLRTGMWDAARDDLALPASATDDEADALWLHELVVHAATGDSAAPDLRDPAGRRARRDAIATAARLIPAGVTA